MSLATGRYVMFPDDDAWLPGSTLAGVVGHLDRHPEHDGLCAQLQDSRGRPSMLRWASTGRRVNQHNHHRTSIGSTMVFRTPVAQASGGFDEAMGPGAGGWLGSCEDADFLLRIIAGGRAVWYEPSLAVHHRDSRRDGGSEAESKALAYGCGQGHMWRSHGFSRPVLAYLLLRRFLGSLIWAMRGRTDIGRAHRAWGRGAINGLLDRPPADIPASDGGLTRDHPPAVDETGTAGVAAGPTSEPQLGKMVALSTIASMAVVAATSALVAIAARRAGTVGVEAVVALVAFALVVATAARGWLLGRETGLGGDDDGRSRRATVLAAEIAGALAVTGDVWLGLLLLPGSAGARFGTAAVLSALISLPAMLATVAVAPRLARLVRHRSLPDAGLLLRSVARLSLPAAIALAVPVALAVGMTTPTIADSTADFPILTSTVLLLAGDLVATALAGASAVLWLTDRHRLGAALALGWLVVSWAGSGLAALLGGGLGLAVAGSFATAGLVALWSATAWVTTGLSIGPRLRPGIRPGWLGSRRRSRYDTEHRIPAGQARIEPCTTLSATSPDLSLIVSTIGRPADFRRMVQSIGREMTSGLHVELVVVDQSGDDETRRILEDADLPVPWRHVRSGTGLSLGRNLGLSLARGRYVTFPDDDVWYAGAMLAAAVTRLDRTPDLAGV
ncbi:MAG: glycosyltransferase, partial [Acidimicrobiia bacterium]|nr:glycosyltransferase [Acidimicrobiia bacterium]